jgi:hypothetical protein
VRGWWLLGLAVTGVACHRINGPCCSDEDCPDNFICSVACAGNDETPGTCLAPCDVDKDCNPGQVCNVFILTCGCEQIDAGEFSNLDAPQFDAGVYGTCSGDIGN